MGFFGGLTMLLSVIGVIIAAFVIGALVGFIGLWLALKKFYPEAWLALDLKVHANNQESILKDTENNDDGEGAEEEYA